MAKVLSKNFNSKRNVGVPGFDLQRRRLPPMAIRALALTRAWKNPDASILALLRSALSTRRWPKTVFNDSRWWLEVSSTDVLLRDKARNNQLIARKPWRAGGFALAQRHGVRPKCRPHIGLPALLTTLGIARDYGHARDLPAVAEPLRLLYAGPDRYLRDLWLHPQALAAWQAMRRSAERNGLAMEIVSAFRSVPYQARIIRQKSARGLSMAEILAVSAAPGYSEHHSGCAIDIAEPGAEVLTEAFAQTEAFAWLQQHAARFGFVMSYPEHNRHGVLFEPWHWCYHPSNTRRTRGCAMGAKI
jgi:zinc D-Ala-D-Ala carboxypeptidase